MKRFAIIIAAMFLVNVFGLASASSAAQRVTEPARWTQKATVGKFPSEVLRLVNLERAKAGLSPLKFADDLAASALVRARELPLKFSHTRPNGSKCFTAMPQTAGAHVLGENLAGGQTSPQQVVQAWMDSKSHRDNIMSKQFKEIGIVYYYQSNTKFKHYWVQHFRG